MHAFFEENEVNEIEAEIPNDETADMSIEEFGVIGTIKCSLCMKAFNKVVSKIPKGAAKVTYELLKSFRCIS